MPGLVLPLSTRNRHRANLAIQSTATAHCPRKSACPTIRRMRATTFGYGVPSGTRSTCLNNKDSSTHSTTETAEGSQIGVLSAARPVMTGCKPNTGTYFPDLERVVHHGEVCCNKPAAQ